MHENIILKRLHTESFDEIRKHFPIILISNKLSKINNERSISVETEKMIFFWSNRYLYLT